ncbi:Ig-like domain-containing protein, partial [Flavobacterium difficile]
FTVDLDPATAGIQDTITTAEGVWTLNPATGVVTFNPANNFNGTATLTYQLCDPSGACDTALITFVVTAVNDTPVANDDDQSATP